MSKSQQLHVTVENFGPIKTGAFALNPLTIFIGPNNSGKSYAALITYALIRGLSGRLPRRFLSPDGVDDFLSGIFDRWPSRMPFGGLPADRRDSLAKQLNQTIDFVRTLIGYSVQEYFGPEHDTLVRSGGRGRTASVQLLGQNDGSPLIRLDFGASAPVVTLEPGLIDDWQVPSPPWSALPVSDETLDGVLARHMWIQILAHHGLPWKNVYYLPSARSGLLAGAQLYRSLAAELVGRRAGLDRIEVTPFQGVAGDFLQILATLQELQGSSNQQETRKKIHPALSLLEENLLAGHVTLLQGPSGRESIRFESKSFSLPIQRSGSMVAELAPVDLWMQHVLVPGDLLIIDEPEAHLHPEHQRRIARVLVRLVRAGVHVLCLTHSSLILHQISNCILAADAEPNVRKDLGLTDDDLMQADEVGVYHFDLGSHGTHIRSVPIEPGFGIPEDEFVQVAEAIGDETYRLETASLSDAVSA